MINGPHMGLTQHGALTRGTLTGTETRGGDGDMGQCGRILVVDDDAGTYETMADILRELGHIVGTATCGRVVLERVAQRRFDVAIIDVKLPDMSGLELLEALEATSPSTEVILISGHASLDSALHAVRGAAFSYLTKPFEIDQLLATIDKALERRRLAEALRVSEERYRLVSENVYLPHASASADLVSDRAAKPARGTETVPLAEDETTVRALTREILHLSGYTVLEAVGPEEGLQVAQQHAGPIHLLLADVVMPGMSGRALADRLQALRPSLRVLFMSGYPSEAIKQHRVMEPNEFFLEKPFTPGALTRKVRDVLDASPSQLATRAV